MATVYSPNEEFHLKICPGDVGRSVLLCGDPGRCEKIAAYFDESEFSLNDMKKKNAESIYLDGVEKVENSVLTYTDELIAKAKKAFGVELPKNVAFEDIDKTAQFIIDEIIMKNVEN